MKPQISKSRTSRFFLGSILGLLAVLLTVRVSAADRSDELWAAANDNDVKAIADIINDGTNVNGRESQTAQTALMAAAMSGHIDAVKLLLVLGSDPNLKESQGKTALNLVQDREKAFAKLPNFAGLVKRQREVIRILVPVTEGGADAKADESAPDAQPADPDTIAHLKLQSARAALSAGLFQEAMKYLSEVFALKGVSEHNRAKSMAITADLSMRRQDWKLAKLSAERVLKSSDTDEEDRDYCQDVIKTLRNYHPEMFE